MIGLVEILITGQINPKHLMANKELTNDQLTEMIISTDLRWCANSASCWSQWPGRSSRWRTNAQRSDRSPAVCQCDGSIIWDGRIRLGFETRGYGYDHLKIRAETV